MTSPGQNTPARRGFLSSISAALTPPPVPEDDNAPLRVPKGVITASVLSIIGGILYLFQGTLGLFNIDSIIDNGRKSYTEQVTTCNNQVGGIGTAATGAAPTNVVSSCQKLPTMTDTDWANYHTVYVVLFVVFALIGIAVLAAGWFLRAGAMWARRTLVTVTLLTVLSALFLQITGALTLAATFAVLIAVVLCYLSSGGQFFLLMKARRKHL
jgi:hypothetical protein